MLCSANCLSKLLSSLITVESYIRASVVHSRLYEAMLLSGFHTACFCRYKKAPHTEYMVSVCGAHGFCLWSLLSLCAANVASVCEVCGLVCAECRAGWELSP